MRTAHAEAQEHWFTVADVARRLDISERALRTAIAAGHLRVVRPRGLKRGRFSMIRIPASALTAWLNGAPTSTDHE
jgi:excisionase family DNA binding protein